MGRLALIAADVEAALVEWALYTLVSTPEARSVSLIHLAMVCAETRPCGYLKLMNK